MTPTASVATTPTSTDPLPVVVIGAGPVGLAAAAHLLDRNLPVLVLEAGEQVGAALSEWGHIRTFTPWQYIVDVTAEKLLAPTGWTRPTDRQSPTGADIVAQYVLPLAGALGPDVVRTGARVVAVSRDGLDRSRSVDRAERPFVVRVQNIDGIAEDVRARAVIDASGTWEQPNPLGSSGLPALGEERARAAGFLVGPLPDVLGRDRSRFAGRTTLVVGMGHSAANTLVALAQLAREAPGTRIVWAIRGTSARRVFGGGTADQLPDRGRLGSELSALVARGALESVTGFAARELTIEDDQTVTVVGDTAEGERVIEGVHNVAAATGFRPDLDMLSELQLDLDPAVQAPRTLGPLIDPSFHSCGTVAPHGWRELAHDTEPGFFVVGMKSYGRAPTFLITTGNEQVRSIAAHLAGDDIAADEVQLILPETGVCSTGNALSDEEAADDVEVSEGCFGSPVAHAASESAVTESLERLRVGFATGVPNGRAGDAEAQHDDPAPRTSMSLADGSPLRSGGCGG